MLGLTGRQREGYKGRRLSSNILSSLRAILTNSIFSHHHQQISRNVRHLHLGPLRHLPPPLQHIRSSKPTRRSLRLFRRLLRPRHIRLASLNLLTQHFNHHPIQHPSQHRNRPPSQRSTRDPHPLRRAVFGSCPCGFCIPVPCPDGHELVEEKGT